MLLYIIRHILVELLGFIFFIAGILMLFLPGPGIVFAFLGLSILATEFVWARRLLNNLKSRKDKYARMLRGYLRF